MAVNCYISGSEQNGQPECSCSFSDIYNTTKLASGLHQVPHLNHLFDRVSSNFSYTREYIEGVAFWSACLILLYLFLMVHCLFYSCCLCRLVHKSRKSGWEKWSRKPNFCLALFGIVAFLGLLTCAVGIWSDVTQNSNLVNFVNVFKSTERLITNLGNDVDSVDVDGLEMVLTDISTEMNSLPSNTTDLDRYKQEVTTYQNITGQIDQDIMQLLNRINQVSLGDLNKRMENGVKYRLIGTMFLFCITALILIASIIYAVKPLTSCTGFVFLAIITICFGVWWMLASLAFGAEIALADFCIYPNPDSFIQQQIPTDPNYQEESRYLLYCHGCSNPLKNYITNLNDNFNDINETVSNFVNFTSQFRASNPFLYQNAITFHLTILETFPIIEHILVNDLSCNETSYLYAKAINDGCNEGLMQFTIETGCAILLALIFLVLTSSQCFIACRLTAFYRNKRKEVQDRLENLPDFTPVSYAQIGPNTAGSPTDARTPRFQYDEGRVGYRRSLLASVTEDDRQVVPAEYSQSHNYQNIQLGIYPPLAPPPDGEFGYANEMPTDFVQEKVDEDSKVRRVSRMEENLFAFFPDIAANVTPEGTRHSLYSIQSQP